MPTDYASGIRSPFQGLTFNTADEAEAFLRALGRSVSRGEFNLNEYRTIKDDINTRYASWQDRNPVSGLFLEGGGALAPGIVAAFVPGGQGVTAASAARVGSLAARAAPRITKVAEAAAEPVTMLVKKAAPNLAVGKKLVPLGVADELLTGALSSAGATKDWRDIPRAVRDDLGLNAAMALGTRGANEAFKAARNWWKGRN